MLETERLQLKQNSWDKEVVRTQVGWLNDPVVVQFSEQRHKQHTLDSQHAYLGKFERLPSHKFREVWHGSEFIGTVTAIIDMNNSVADLGIMIGPKFHGQGYGSEAWKAFADYLSNVCSIRKLEAGCMGCNNKMMKICLSSGFKEEGRRWSHFLISGINVDMVMFGRM